MQVMCKKKGCIDPSCIAFLVVLSSVDMIHMFAHARTRVRDMFTPRHMYITW